MPGSALCTWPGFAELVLYPGIVATLFGYSAWSFKLRARNGGKLTCEVERHRCTVGRIDRLLDDLGEPLAENEKTV